MIVRLGDIIFHAGYIFGILSVAGVEAIPCEIVLIGL